MAGTGKPGPAKGSGGRPRTKTPATRKDGYKRVTVGAKGKGTQVYEHRAKMGATGTKGAKGKTGPVVDHRNRKKGDNRSSNLRRVSRSTNAKNT